MVNPGTITVEIAEIVSPGNVVDIDIETSQFQIGKAQALEKSVMKYRCEAVGWKEE